MAATWKSSLQVKVASLLPVFIATGTTNPYDRDMATITTGKTGIYIHDIAVQQVKLCL